jgi:hypothetical protein
LQQCIRHVRLTEHCRQNVKADVRRRRWLHYHLTRLLRPCRVDGACDIRAPREQLKQCYT